MDSVSEPSRHDLAALPRERRGDVVGKVGFEGLCVREPGVYRVRVTLTRVCGDVYESVAQVDTGVFSVAGAGAGARLSNGVGH
jgi:hypothetical protein